MINQSQKQINSRNNFYCFTDMYLLPSPFRVELEVKVREDSSRGTQLKKSVWRVLAWNAKRQLWTIRSTHDEQDDAAQHAEAMQHHDPRLRVRIKPSIATVLEIKPAIVNSSTHFRHTTAGQMSDLADSKKRYKSPG